MIISGFAGIGKSTMSKKNPDKCIDLDSSNYKWLFDESIKDIDIEERKGKTEKVLNPDWPMNYIEDIKKYSKEYDFVFISIDMDVRNILKEEGIHFYVAYPLLECKEEYISRYKERNNGEAFIKLLERNFDSLIEELMNTSGSQIRLKKGEYISDKFNF